MTPRNGGPSSLQPNCTPAAAWVVVFLFGACFERLAEWMQQIDRTTLLKVSSRKDSCGRLGSLNRLGWLRCLPQIRSDLRSNKCLPQLSYNVLLETLGESNTIPYTSFPRAPPVQKDKALSKLCCEVAKASRL